MLQDVVYFDLRPKRDREDFFNYERELQRLLEAFRRERFVLVLGPRRVGKTSLLLTALSEVECKVLFIDVREAVEERGVSEQSFLQEVENQVNSLLRRDTDREALRRCLETVGLDVQAGQVRVSQVLHFPRVLEALMRWGEFTGQRIVLAFDELQELRGMRIRWLLNHLAYAYDHLEHTTVVATGSQVGLLFDTLRLHEPESPLFGRAFCEVCMGPLSPRAARQFLIEGFRQVGKKPPRTFITEAVQRLDGIIGWLTYAGWKAAYEGVVDLEAILVDAGRLALSELEHFLRQRPQARTRYLSILQVLAAQPRRWSELLRAVELPEATLHRLLATLEKANLVTKRQGRYWIVDPVLAYALLNLMRLKGSNR